MPTATAPAANSFLVRCTADLDPRNISSSECKAILWKGAALATFIAFTVLSVGATVSIATATYLPLAGVAVVLLAIPTAEVSKTFYDFSKNAEAEAAKYRGIQRNYENLKTLGEAPIVTKLRDREINWAQIPGMQGHPEKVADLKPLLARAEYLDNAVQRYFEKRDNLIRSARDLANTHFTENRDTIYVLRQGALFAEENALETKIQAAFANAVLRKYDFNGTLEDIATLTNITFAERALGNELNERTGLTHFLTFKNPSLAPLTYAEIKGMSIVSLGQRLALAMA